jgi:AP-2 complex subunit alpha
MKGMVLTLLFQILKGDNQLRNANQELQQRAIEYLKLSSIATDDLLVSSWLCNPAQMV